MFLQCMSLGSTSIDIRKQFESLELMQTLTVIRQNCTHCVCEHLVWSCYNLQVAPLASLASAMPLVRLRD